MNDVDKIRKIRNDPWEFLKGVRTLDEIDQSKPVKAFPIHLLYLKLYVRLWVKYRRFLVPKSRRMKMTWINVCLFLWDAMFHAGRHIAFVSKKEEDADILVQRAKFVIENLDPEIIPIHLLPKWAYKYCELRFPDLDSKIHAYPSGADQLRQHTLSGLFADELGFWPDAQKMYSGSKPTLEGGGRFVGVSSAAPGFFKRMVFDQLDAPEEEISELDEVMGAKIHIPIEGVRFWRNPKNRFAILEIHYAADPEKRSAEWKARESADMPRSQWDQEYEIEWESYAGRPVYQKDWDKKIHLVNGPIHPHIGLPLLRGWDFGLMPSAIIAQLREEEFAVLAEFIGINMGVERFKPIVIMACFNMFPQWLDMERDWLDFADASGVKRSETDEETCFSVLASPPHKLNPMPGAITFTERRKSVSELLGRTFMGEDGQRPCFQISATRCPLLVRGFNGGYRYPEDAFKVEPAKIMPVKDQFSHPHDGLQMITSRLMTLPKKRGAPIPGAVYGAKRQMRRDAYGRAI